MTATVTTKAKAQKPKYSYAQRVLKAYSDLRHRQKKDIIHVTSIKNQVKKNAETKNDKLGPHWQTRVTSTVHHLEDAGVLSQTPRRASVAFTPEAKRRLAKERRLSTPQGLSDDGEYSLFRNLAHNFAAGDSQPTRDRRRSTGTGSVFGGSTTSTRSPSRMTKAELVAELEMLRGATTTPSQFEGSRRGPDHRVENRDDMVSEVEVEFTQGNTTQQSNEPVTPLKDRISQLRVPEGLMRTPSGTYISRISKQPTPEPSESDQHSDADRHTEVDFNEMDFGGAMDDSFAPQDDSLDSDMAQGVNAPVSQEQNDDDDEVAELKQRFDEMARERETLIANFESDINDLQSKLAVVEDDRDLTQLDLAQKTEEHVITTISMAELQSSFNQLATRLTSTETELQTAKKELSSEREKTEKLEAELASSTTGLELANTRLVEADAALATAQQDIVDFTVQASSDADAWNEERASFTKQVETLNDEQNAMEEELKRSESALKDLTSAVSEKDTLIGKLKSTLQEKERALEVQLQVSDNRRHETLQLADVNDMLRSQLQVLQQTLAPLHARVEELTTQLANVQATRVDQDHRIVVLRHELLDTREVARHREEGLQAIVDQTAHQIIASQMLIEQLEARVAERDEEVTNVEGQLAQRTEALAHAADEYASLEGRLSEVARELRVSEAQVEDLRVKLGEMETRATNAEDEVENLRTSLADRNDAMEEVKGTFEKFKEYEALVEKATRRMSEVPPASPQKKRKRSEVVPSTLGETSMF